jgi:hypothetical protein
MEDRGWVQFPGGYLGLAVAGVGRRAEREGGYPREAVGGRRGPSGRSRRGGCFLAPGFFEE